MTTTQIEKARKQLTKIETEMKAVRIGSARYEELERQGREVYDMIVWASRR